MFSASIDFSSKSCPSTSVVNSLLVAISEAFLSSLEVSFTSKALFLLKSLFILK